MIVNDLNKKSEQKSLQSNFLLKQETTVNTYLHKIDKINDDIHELCEKKEIKVDDTDRVTDFKDEIKYEIGVQEKISDVQTKITPVKTDTSSHTPTATPIRPPKLKCPSFSGLEKDRLLFQNFLMQFNNVMPAGGKLDDSAKLTYFRGYLTDYAFSVISHLSISNENYKAALDLLNAEFLDKEFIIEEYFTKIISSSPKYDPQFEDVKKYLNETRACIHDLKNYGVDLLLPNSSGLKLISHIVFNKLPAIDQVWKRKFLIKKAKLYHKITMIIKSFSQNLVVILVNLPCINRIQIPKGLLHYKILPSNRQLLTPENLVNFGMQVVMWCTDVRNIILMRPEGSVVLKWVYVFFGLVHFTKSNNVLAKIMSQNINVYIARSTLI